MSMMIHSEKKIGTITRRTNKNLWVEIDQGCDRSSPRCTVGCGGCSGNTRPRKAIISPINPEKYPIGQKIEFLHVSLNENLVAFIVFGIPISAVFFTQLLWYLFSPASVETPISFLSAAAALLAGFAIVAAVDFWFRSKFPSKILSTFSSEITVES
jgi:hypothetical protein